MTTRRSLLFASAASALSAADLQPKTVKSFDSYIQSRESQLHAHRIEGGRFLWAEESQARVGKLKQGGIAIEKTGKDNPIDVPGGLIHDWTGSVLIPATSVQDVVGLVQNYNQHKNIYKPEVVDSKLLSRAGSDYQVFLRLLKKKVITVVLNTEHDVRYFAASPTRVHSRSYSRKIAEVSDPGTPQERELAPGEDHGFLWKLYSYWRFDQRQEGVYVECEAISLTRGIPFGLGWMIEPIIRDLPFESLQKTLAATRDALKRPA